MTFNSSLNNIFLKFLDSEFYSLESLKTATFSFQNFSKGKRANFKASDM